MIDNIPVEMKYCRNEIDWKLNVATIVSHITSPLQLHYCPSQKDCPSTDRHWRLSECNGNTVNFNCQHHRRNNDRVADGTFFQGIGMLGDTNISQYWIYYNCDKMAPMDGSKCNEDVAHKNLPRGNISQRPGKLIFLLSNSTLGVTFSFLNSTITIQQRNRINLDKMVTICDLEVNQISPQSHRKCFGETRRTRYSS